MTFRFLDISENDEQEFKTQLRIAYNSHFKNTKPFDDVFTDWNVPELSIQNDLYFNDIENVELRKSCVLISKIEMKRR